MRVHSGDSGRGRAVTAADLAGVSAPVRPGSLGLQSQGCREAPGPSSLREGRRAGLKCGGKSRPHPRGAPGRGQLQERGAQAGDEAERTTRAPASLTVDRSPSRSSRQSVARFPPKHRGPTRQLAAASAESLRPQAGSARWFPEASGSSRAAQGARLGPAPAHRDVQSLRAPPLSTPPSPREHAGQRRARRGREPRGPAPTRAPDSDSAVTYLGGTRQM